MKKLKSKSELKNRIELKDFHCEIVKLLNNK